jgi:hypothetical protein
MKGDCFRIHANALLDDPEFEDALLVQGYPQLRRPPYRKYSHAWIEKGDEAIDLTVDFRGPKMIFYAIGNVEEVFRYTRDETRIMLLLFRHYGPWEGPEACGPIPLEEVETW